MTTEKKLNYNFVFLFAYDDYWQAILGKELYHGSNSRVYRTAFEGSRIEQLLFHYHWAYSINSKIKLPFKKLWFSRMYKQNFTNNLPICFVFMGGNNIRFDSGFCKYIKDQDSRNKIMILHNDLISKHCVGYDYNEIRKKADVITTYDKVEAEKYGIEYFQETTYSKLISEPQNVVFEYDVYFLGAAKDRLPKIYDVYKYLINKGFRCKFIVTGVSKEKQIEGIEYSNGISYIKNLEYIIKSKCILEVIQAESCDITTRALEAIAYRRKFLTDCPMELSGFFHDNQICKYRNINDISLDFLNSDFSLDEFNPLIDINPLKRLYFIQSKLEKINE